MRIVKEKPGLQPQAAGLTLESLPATSIYDEVDRFKGNTCHDQGNLAQSTLETGKKMEKTRRMETKCIFKAVSTEKWSGRNKKQHLIRVLVAHA